MSESRRKFYPSSIRELEALLEAATRPGTRARIQARIEDRRYHNARKHTLRREAFRARTPDEVAAVRTERYPDGRKTCSQCKTALPFAEFGTCPTTADGLWSGCRPCSAKLAEAAR
jgi:hypothetical protein